MMVCDCWWMWNHGPLLYKTCEIWLYGINTSIMNGPMMSKSTILLHTTFQKCQAKERQMCQCQCHLQLLMRYTPEVEKARTWSQKKGNHHVVLWNTEEFVDNEVHHPVIPSFLHPFWHSFRFGRYGDETLFEYHRTWIMALCQILYYFLPSLFIYCPRFSFSVQIIYS